MLNSKPQAGERWATYFATFEVVSVENDTVTMDCVSHPSEAPHPWELPLSDFLALASRHNLVRQDG